MQANQLIAILAVGCSLGTAFFAALGLTAKHDFFLLLGNVACVFGNAVFIVAIGDGNPTWQTYFGALALLSAYTTYRMFLKYQRFGCDDDDDDEDDRGAGDDEGEREEAERRLLLQAAAPAAAAGVDDERVSSSSASKASSGGLRRRKRRDT